MTTVQHQQVRMGRQKREGPGVLFQINSPPTRSDHFDNIFQQFKRESAQAAKNQNNHDIHSKHGLHLQVPLPKEKPQKSKSPRSRETHPEQETDSEGRRTRAMSSNKFDCLPRPSRHHKNKKFIQHIFEMVKKESDQKEGSSKKSTDNSTSTQIEKIMAENQIIAQRIKLEERKAGKLERQILQEKKKHELHKQLYEHNIERLKKKVAVESPYMKRIQEQQESLNNQQQFDRLSIESH